MNRAGTWAARAAALVVAVVLAGPSGGARAEGPGPSRAGVGGSGVSARAPIDADDPLPLDLPAEAGAPVDEAQVHFRRGVRLYADGNAASALIELKRAYALVPNFRILFNLGQVAYQCGDHAAAFGYLTRYLTEGGARVPDARRKEVAHDLADLRSTVGYLAIETKEPGLRVTVDDAEAGTTPFAAPIPANAGRRRIEIVAPAGERQTRVVQLVAGEILSVSFAALVPAASPAPSGPSLRRSSPEPERPRAVVLTPTLALAPEVAAPAVAVPLPEIGLPAPPPVITPPPISLVPIQRTTPPEVPLASEPPLPERARRVAPWLTWTLAAIVAGGAGATGALAWSTSRTLQDKAATYPVTAGELQSLHDRERRYALASDGLLAGAVVLSALALYFTVSGSPASDGEGSGPLTARRDR